jgi:hypothetical protein
MPSFSAHLDGVLGGLNDERPMRPYRARPEPVYKGKRAPAPDHHVAQLVSAAGFSWLGRSRRLRFTSTGPDAELTRDGHGWWLNLREGCGTAAVEALYAREGVALCEQVSAYTASRLGVTGHRFEARDLGEHPARCYPSRGLIVLHWAVFGLHREHVDHALAGQFAHLSLGTTRRSGEWWKVMYRLHPAAGDHEDRFAVAWSQAWIGALESKGGQ